MRFLSLQAPLHRLRNLGIKTFNTQYFVVCCSSMAGLKADSPSSRGLSAGEHESLTTAKIQLLPGNSAPAQVHPR